MRRVTLMVAAMALMVALFAAVAYAVTIEGTRAGEVLLESELNDTMFGRGGGDEIFGSLFGPEGEEFVVSAERDVAYGNKGPDLIDVTDGDGRDTAKGGNGEDKCFGDPNDQLNCEHEHQ